MFDEGFLKRLSRGSGFIGVNLSRCLRTRFNKSTCRACAEACSVGALKLEPAPAIDEAACTGCMLCASECPAGALSVDSFSFLNVLAGIKKVRGPVLGCSMAEGVAANEKAPCLGLISEEHIIALALLEGAGGPVQINVVGCERCANGFVLTTLRRRMKDVEGKTGLDIKARVVLVEKRDALRYEEAALDRRGFFSVLRSVTFKEAASVVTGFTGEPPQMPFSYKTLPIRRALINRALASAIKARDRKLAGALLGHYYYSLSVDDSCNQCFACMGVCPSGAIEIDRDRPDLGVMFNSSLCSGCGLCVGFCMSGSITLSRGYEGEEPFALMTCGGAKAADEGAEAV